MKKITIFILAITFYSCQNTNELVPLNNFVSTDFMPSLSEMNIYSGTLSNLDISSNAFEYKISTELFSDYSYKQRLIALPQGETMVYQNNLLPDFPMNTVIAKTFYYNQDDRNPALGKTIVETRVLIKKSNGWLSGNYIWNNSQTDAYFDTDGGTAPINFIDNNGENVSINYEIPSNQDCITCHQNDDYLLPIGPKLRNMNLTVEGINQLQDFVNKSFLTNGTDLSLVESVPNWSDEAQSLEVRSRAYLDINCAHCHQPGGYFETVRGYTFVDFRYEVNLNDSNIYTARENILYRIQTDSPAFGMPFLGTTIIHSEGVNLIEAYIDSLN